MKPSGAHTHPELRGSGGGNGWLIVLGAVVLAAIAGPAAHAISHLIQVLAITLAVVLAIAGLAAILTCWVRHKNTRAEISTSTIARLLASDMREELLAIMREIFKRNAFAERLAYSPDEAAELLGISRELVHDLLRTGELGSVKAGRRRLIGKHHLEEFLAREQ